MWESTFSELWNLIKNLQQWKYNLIRKKPLNFDKRVSSILTCLPSPTSPVRQWTWKRWPTFLVQLATAREINMDLVLKKFGCVFLPVWWLPERSIPEFALFRFFFSSFFFFFSHAHELSQVELRWEIKLCSCLEKLFCSSSESKT